jgi:hypothetical protein
LIANAHAQETAQNKLKNFIYECFLGFIRQPSKDLHTQVVKIVVRGASKIKLKNVNKKRMATARRLLFLEFLKASIADLIYTFFSSLQNSEGGGDSDSADSFADPCQFLPFPKTKI